MENKDLQVESGNFTRIVNPLIEELIKIPFKGCELAVAVFIIRKTYGYQKKQDEISLTQFQEGLNRSRQTIVSALKNLQLVNIARLVKTGSSRKHSNLWEINKYFDTWKLVNMARLVKRKRGTSLTEPLKLVKTARHTKENTKENTKEIGKTSLPPPTFFDSNAYIEEMIKEKARHKEIIGRYFRIKKCDFPSLKAVQAEVVRWVKTASTLKEYSNEDIGRTIQFILKDEFLRDIWTLETVAKKIINIKSL